jgi:hypothetical protein
MDHARVPRRWRWTAIPLGSAQGSPPSAGSPGRSSASFRRSARSAPPRRWAARAISGPVRPDATLTVDPLEDNARSQLTFSIDYEASGVGKVILPLVIRQTRSAAPASFRRLKERLKVGASARRELA